MKKIKSLFQNRVFKGIFLISSGTTLAQAINLLIQPIITRIYTPEDFGILTLYIAILSSVTIIGSLKYESAIPIAKDEKIAINVFALSFIVLILIFFISILVFIFFSSEIFSFLNANTLYKYRYFIPIGILFVGIYNLLSEWALRNRDYTSISKTKLNQSINSNITRIVTGLLKFGPVGLILGQVISVSSGIFTLGKPLYKKRRELVKYINLKNIILTGKRYKRFPIYSAPSQFMNSAGLQLPIFFLTGMFSSQVIGFYGLANSVVNLPMGLIGKSVGNVFYGEAANIGRKNPQKIKKLSNKLLIRLLILGLIPTIVLLFFGPTLFHFVFGPRWFEAGVYAQILSILVLFRFIFTPISHVFSVFEEQKKALFLDTLRVILVLLSFSVSIYLKLSPYTTVLMYTAVMCIVYFTTYVVAQSILNKHIKQVSYN